MNDSDDAAPERGIDQSDVMEKYKAAGGIVDQAMDVLRKALYSGMKISTLCQLGDTLINKSCGSVYQKARTENGERLDKGVAFPTCICVKNCASHFCPMETDAEASMTVSAGDVVTISCGSHIDGYSALGAQTWVVREAKEAESSRVTGREADVVAAAYTAVEAALRVMRPGHSNWEVSDVIQKVAREYEVEPLEGVLSHEMKRYVLDGSKVMLNKQTAESRAEQWKFEEFEVYNLDVVMSTGEGRAIERNTRETIYKRQVDVDYKLKMKTSRQVLSEINKRFPTMPFTLRVFEDAKKARMGMTEMLKHGLVTSYAVLYEKEEAVLGRCSVTVLVTPTQNMVITKSVRPELETDKEVKDEGILKLLATSIDKKKKKKKRSKKAGGGAKAAGGDGEDGEDGDGMET